MNVHASVARARFDEASKGFSGQFSGLEIRTVFRDLNGVKLLLGGQVRYFDEQPKSIEVLGPYKSLAVSQALLPIAESVPFLDRLFQQGRIEVPGLSVQIAAPSGGQLTTDLVENRIERNFEDQDEDRFGVSWFAAHPDDLFGVPAMEALEKELRTSAMFTDLKDLLDVFTPGLDAGRGKPIRFDLRVPVLIGGKLIRHGTRLELSLRCGGRIDTSKLNLTLRMSKHSLAAARGNKPAKLDPASISWRKEGHLQVGQKAIESPLGAPSEVLIAYEGYPITIYESEAGARPLEELLLGSARPQPMGLKAPRWKNIVHGEKYPFAFLDLDAAGSKKMLEDDASRTKPALEHLQQAFDRVVNEHEGVPFWGGGDGAVGYFVGEGKERLALLAAIKILMLAEAHFLDNHNTSNLLRLRAGLHTGNSEWKKDLGKNISSDLSAAGHIQKHDKSAPRLTASADFVAQLPPELRNLLVPTGTSEGIEILTWCGFSPFGPVSAKLPLERSGQSLESAPLHETGLGVRLIERYCLSIEKGFGGADFLVGVPISVHNADPQAVGVDEVRICGELKSSNGKSLPIERWVDHVETLNRLTPKHTFSWPSSFPQPVPKEGSVRLSVAFELRKDEYDLLGGPSASISLEAEIELQDVLGRIARATVRVST